MTGVSLGLAHWNAVDAGSDVIDLVPVYVFHTRVNGDDSSDVEVLALDPGVITFTTVQPPVPEPLPAQIVPTPETGAAPTPSTSAPSLATGAPAAKAVQ